MADQLSLFRNSLNPIPRVKEAMRLAIKNSGLSREQVVDGMNELARTEGLTTGGRAKETSVDLMEKWLSNSADHLIPWKLIPIFCAVVNSIDPIRPLLTLLGADAINQDDYSLLEWARAEKLRREIRKKQRLLEGKIGL